MPKQSELYFKASSSDPREIQKNIQQLMTMFESPLLYEKKVVSTIFEAIKTLAETLLKRPYLVSKVAYISLFDLLLKHQNLFSKNMQKQFEVWRNSPTLDNAYQENENPIKMAPITPEAAEEILQLRTNRISLVLDRCYDIHNIHAILRTAECLGIQYIDIVLPVEVRGALRMAVKDCDQFLTIREFETPELCLEALRQEGRTIWATDLSTQAISLDTDMVQIPNKVALVMGRESDGCSQIFLNAASQRVYLPMHGFTESLNLSVATALIIQQLLHFCPEAVGNLSDIEKQELRQKWENLHTNLPLELEVFQRFKKTQAPPNSKKRARKEQLAQNKKQKITDPEQTPVEVLDNGF